MSYFLQQASSISSTKVDLFLDTQDLVCLRDTLNDEGVLGEVSVLGDGDPILEDELVPGDEEIDTLLFKTEVDSSTGGCIESVEIGVLDTTKSRISSGNSHDEVELARYLVESSSDTD